jgi:hypothetical protein
MSTKREPAEPHSGPLSPKWPNLWKRGTSPYVALTLLFAYPLTARPLTDVLAGGPDAHLYLWTIAWNAYAFLHQPLALFDANIYHPLPNTLAFSENLIGTALIAAPVEWLTGNLVLAMNLASLASVVLCGLGAALLARRLGLGPAAAFLCGAIFAFAPPRFFRTGQTHLAIQWLPFALAYATTYFDRGRARDLRLALLFLSLQALTSGHGAVFLGLALLALAGWRVAHGMPLAPAQRARDVGLTGAASLLPALAVQIPYWSARANVGLSRTLDDWGINPVSFLASPARGWSWLLARFPSTARVNVDADAFLFPGLVVLVMAGLAFRPLPAALRPLGQSRAFYAALGVLSLWLAVGPPIGLWQFVYWLPGLNFIREASRFTMLTMLCLAVLAAIGLERWQASVAPRRRPLVALVIVSLFLADAAAMPLPVMRPPIEIPAADRWLDSQPKPFAVAEVPLPNPAHAGPFERRQTAYMFHAMGHWQKTVHGYSGVRAPVHDALYRAMRGFPDHAALAALESAGVTYVVVHPRLYDAGEWPVVEAAIAARGDRLALVYRDPSGQVYRLARHAP